MDSLASRPSFLSIPTEIRRAIYVEVLHGKCIQISQHGCPRLIYLTEAGNIRGGHPVSLGLLFACRQISSELLSFSTAHLPLTYNYYLSTGEHAFTTDMISVTHRQRARELQIHVSARRPRQNHNVPRREKIDHLIQNLPRLEKIEMHFSYLWNQATMNADPGCLGANLYYDLLTGMIQSVHSGASDRLEQSLCGPSASAKLLDTLHDYRQWLKTLRDAMSQAGHETRELTTGVHIDFIRWEYVSLDTDVHYQVEAGLLITDTATEDARTEVTLTPRFRTALKTSTLTQGRLMCKCPHCEYHTLGQEVFVEVLPATSYDAVGGGDQGRLPAILGKPCGRKLRRTAESDAHENVDTRYDSEISDL